MIRNAQTLSTAARHVAREAGCPFCEAEGPSRFPTIQGRSQVIEFPGIAEQYMVMQDAFPIGGEGAHLLVSPRDHYRSLAGVPFQKQLQRTVNATVSLLQSMFPGRTILVFEHGTGTFDKVEMTRGGNSVDHAHGHFIVLDRCANFEEIRAMTEGEFAESGWDVATQRAKSQDIFSGQAAITGGNPYIHLGMVSGNDRYSYTYTQASAAQHIPSQLLRRIASTACGKAAPAEWDWKYVTKNQLHARIADLAAKIDVFYNRFGRHVIATAA